MAYCDMPRTFQNYFISAFWDSPLEKWSFILNVFFFFFFFSYRSSSALHRRSSTEILPHYWGTFCAGVCPLCVFSFLAVAGFKPTSW